MVCPDPEPYPQNLDNDQQCREEDGECDVPAGDRKGRNRRAKGKSRENDDETNKQSKPLVGLVVAAIRRHLTTRLPPCIVLDGRVGLSTTVCEVSKSLGFYHHSQSRIVNSSGGASERFSGFGTTPNVSGQSC